MHTSQSDTNAPPPIMLSLWDDIGDAFKPGAIAKDVVGSLTPSSTRHFTSDTSNDWKQTFNTLNNNLKKSPFVDKVPESSSGIVYKTPSATVTGIGYKTPSATATGYERNPIDYGFLNPGGQLSSHIMYKAPEFIPNETQVLPFLCNSMCQLSCDAFTDKKDTLYTEDDLAHLCFKDNNESNPYPVCQQRCVNTLSNMPLAKLVAKLNPALDGPQAGELCNKVVVTNPQKQTLSEYPTCLLPNPCQGFSDFYNITAGDPYPACAPQPEVPDLWETYQCGLTPTTGATPRPGLIPRSVCNK